VFFLWFKDNFYQFRDLSFPLFVPLIPLCLILATQIILFLRRRLPCLKITIPKSSWILVLLLLLAFGIRLPFLIHYAGWIDSDDAVMALMGKHIADGKVPPLSVFMVSTGSALFWPMALPYYLSFLDFRSRS